MDSYKITVHGNITHVQHRGYNFNMDVFVNDGSLTKTGTALLEATLYIENGCYMPLRSYFFEAVDSKGQPLLDADIDVFKTMVGFYFNTVLGTDLFVKSIPRVSALCPAEVRDYHYNNVEVG